MSGTIPANLMQACCATVVGAAEQLRVDALVLAQELDLARIIRLLDTLSEAVEDPDADLNDMHPYFANELAGIMHALPTSNEQPA